MIGHPEHHKRFNLDEGKYYFEVQPLLMGQGQIIAVRGPELPDPGDYDIIWMYQGLTDAIIAMINWQAGGFEGEPQGWIRSSPPVYRRRPLNGTEADEIIGQGEQV